MIVKMLEKIFNKHPVKSVTITVCMTCLILAYLLFGSGLINLDKINQNHMKVDAQYEEYEASEVEKDTDIKSEDGIEKITETENSEIENAQAESVSNIEKVTFYTITVIVIILEVVILIFLGYLFIDLFRA